MASFSIKCFFSELRRRRVFAVVALYAVAAWAVIEVGDMAIDAGMIAGLSTRNLFTLALIGLPLALIAGWFYDISRNGIVRTAPAGADDSFRTSLQFKDYLLLLALVVVWSGAYVWVHTPAPVDKSIAVLPFENRGNDPENAQFAFGLHDDLMTHLQRIQDLTLIASSSVEKLNPDTSDRNVGITLGAAYIMKGSVERVLDRIRVNVVLIEAAEEKQAWAGSFDRELSAVNLFDIRDEITSAITENLRAVVSPEAASRVFGVLPTSSLEAYNLYVRGRQLAATRHGEKIKQALQLFERAVEIDPEFALAWVGLGDTSFWLGNGGFIDPVESREKMRQAIEKALALDDQLGEAYASLAMLHYDSGETEQAAEACEKSKKLSPNYARTWHYCGTVMAFGATAEEQLAMTYHAARLDPLDTALQLNIAIKLWWMGRNDEALEQFRHVLQTDPDYHHTYRWLGYLRKSQGQLAEAVRLYRRALELNPGYSIAEFDLAIVYQELGEFAALRDIARQIADSPNLSGDFREFWFTGIDAWTSLRQGDWAAALERMAEVPLDSWSQGHLAQHMTTVHLAAGNLQEARDLWFGANPGWADPGQWQEMIPDNGACVTAGIWMDSGNERLARNLISRAEEYWEETWPAQVLDADRDSDVWVCYLVEGSRDKALDYYEHRVEHGHIAGWWLDRLLPWWGPLRNKPRFMAMERNIDQLLADQRELLREVEDSEQRSTDMSDF